MIEPASSSYICPITIGRQTELDLIRDRLRSTTPRLMLVSGEAGIGKSRLVGDVAAEAAQLGYQVVQGHCFEADAGLPFAPLRDLLHVLRANHSLEELAHLAGPHAAPLTRVLPEIAATIQDEAIGPSPDKRDLFGALDRLFAGLAVASPTLVVVEDLHWSDEASLEFLLFLARRSTARPVALLATYRKEEVSPDLAHFLAELDRGRLALEISLERLVPGEVDAMLRAILGLTRPAPAELLHMLSTLTEGNPFFIEEVLKSLESAGAAPSPAGAWIAPELDALHVPRSVQDAVRRRSARLSPAARQFLVLAAVVGVRFDVAFVRELASLDEVELVAVLKELAAARLVEEESVERFVFRHALTRQAIYADLLTRERQALHREVATRLERSATGVDGAGCSDLAYHFFAATAWAQALPYSWRAGDHAMTLYAPRAALEHYTRAMEAARRASLAPDPELVRARGAAYELLGEFDRALAEYEAARDLARAHGQRATEVAALLSLGLLWAARDYRRAGEAIRDALAVARELGDDALIARCLNRLGNWLLNNEQPREAQHCHVEALSIVEKLGDRRGVAETLDLLGLVEMFGGNLADGTKRLQAAAEVWREIGDQRGLASSLILQVMRSPTYHTDSVPAVIGHVTAQHEVDEGLAITRAIGWRAGESWALWMAGGMNLAPHGAYARAFAALAEALSIAEEIEHRQWQAATHCMLGNAHADLLDLPLAREHLERARDIAHGANALYWTMSASGWLAAVAVAQGDLSSAESSLSGALNADDPMETPARRVLWRAAAELALAKGDPEQALHIVDRLVTSAPGGAGRPIARLEYLRGEALLALEAKAAAEEAFCRARDTASHLGTRALLWRIQLALGRLYHDEGRGEDAATAFAAVRALIAELGAEVPDDALRTRFMTAAATMLPRGLSPQSGRDRSVGPGRLTSREREVTRLLTQGQTNRQIAAALFITEWTAATHVRNILAKLGLTSRTQIAAWAVEHGVADRDERSGTPPRAST